MTRGGVGRLLPQDDLRPGAGSGYTVRIARPQTVSAGDAPGQQPPT
jgi:hypothetical protein